MFYIKGKFAYVIRTEAKKGTDWRKAVNPVHIVADVLVSLHRDDAAFWTSDARTSSLELWRHDRWHVLQYDVRTY